MINNFGKKHDHCFTVHGCLCYESLWAFVMLGHGDKEDSCRKQREFWNEML